MKKPSRKEQRAAKRKEAERIFLEYHEGTSWAHDKLKSGTAGITAESVAFMVMEIARRRDIAAHAKAIAEENAAVDLAARLAANAE